MVSYVVQFEKPVEAICDVFCVLGHIYIQNRLTNTLLKVATDNFPNSVSKSAADGNNNRFRQLDRFLFP